MKKLLNTLKVDHHHIKGILLFGLAAGLIGLSYTTHVSHSLFVELLVILGAVVLVHDLCVRRAFASTFYMLASIFYTLAYLFLLIWLPFHIAIIPFLMVAVFGGVLLVHFRHVSDRVS